MRAGQPAWWNNLTAKVATRVGRKGPLSIIKPEATCCKSPLSGHSPGTFSNICLAWDSSSVASSRNSSTSRSAASPGGPDRRVGRAGGTVGGGMASAPGETMAR